MCLFMWFEVLYLLTSNESVRRPASVVENFVSLEFGIVILMTMQLALITPFFSLYVVLNEVHLMYIFSVPSGELRFCVAEINRSTLSLSGYTLGHWKEL